MTVRFRSEATRPRPGCAPQQRGRRAPDDASTGLYGSLFIRDASQNGKLYFIILKKYLRKKAIILSFLFPWKEHDKMRKTHPRFH